MPCSAGTYSTVTEPGFCFPCTAGYVCLGETTTDTPQTAAADNGYPCPKGYYCPEGSTKELPCPVGTYTDEFNTTSLAGCKSCAANTYNDIEGQKGCIRCSGTATAAIGSTECKCIGVGRDYIKGTGECFCGQGYSSADGSENQNSEYNCELETEITCPQGEVPDITGKTCISHTALCALECAGIGDGTGTFIESVRKCECSTIGDYDSGCAAASCTTNKYVEYDCDGKVTVYNSDGTVATTAFDPSTISGVYGTFKCTRDDCKCTSSSLSISGDQFVYDFAESAVARRLLRHLKY